MSENTLHQTPDKNKEKLEVEGLFYRDGTPISILIENGHIKDVIKKTKLEDPEKHNLFIGPGLIDIQVNGYLGHGFTTPGLTVENVKEITQNLWRVGVTTYLPTLITADSQILLENFAILASAMRDSQVSWSVPGFHLEGPYISPIDGFRGAHNRKWIHPPNIHEFNEFLTAASGKILLVSLAPELPGAIDFIRYCQQKSISTALAHHNASTQIIKQAVAAGARLSTHLGNGMANTIARHDNPLWPQLAEENLSISIIVDGFHLTPEMVKVFYKAKGPDKIILVSDTTDLAGLPPGQYIWDNKKIELKPEGVIFYPEQNVLAGAAAPLINDIGNMIQFTSCKLAEAIDMVSKNPAKLLGLDDRGIIEPGKRADLILFTIQNNRLEIKKTLIAGKTVYHN